MRRIARFLALPRAERRVFVRAWMLVSLLAIALRSGGLRRARTIGRTRTRVSPRDVPARRVAHLVALAARFSPLPAACLPIGLATQRLLRERGIAAELRVGVRKSAGRLEAHAWVEVGGVPVCEEDRGETFLPFPKSLAPQERASS